MISALVKRYWLQLLVVALIGVLAFFVNHYRDNAITYKDQRDKALVRADTSEAVTANVIQAVNIINAIAEANQDAKNQIALESQRAQADIKVAVADDDCARRPVPVAAADRLRQYADSLRSGSGGTDSVKPDF
uniref:DUF2570 domain-containing protein n=1 Tax=Enterobacter roggenkampii TaxID=1812935 RepID=UPI0020CBB41D|nr:DUF2570 domain-containing protein [Enterobacter roggenkampii]